MNQAKDFCEEAALTRPVRYSALEARINYQVKKQLIAACMESRMRFILYDLDTLCLIVSADGRLGDSCDPVRQAVAAYTASYTTYVAMVESVEEDLHVRGSLERRSWYDVALLDKHINKCECTGVTYDFAHVVGVAS